MINDDLPSVAKASLVASGVLLVIDEGSKLVRSKVEPSENFRVSILSPSDLI